MSFIERAAKPFIITIFGIILTAALVFTAFLPHIFSEAAVDVIVSSSSEQESTPVSNESDAQSSEDEAVSAPNPLKITAPASKETTVTTGSTVFSGSCDPSEALYINGELIKTADDGSFSVNFNLKTGKNTFKIEYNGSQQVYTVNYRYVILSGYSPSDSRSFESGSTMVVRATARFGSSVSATFMGKKITLNREYYNGDGEKPEFIGYIGSFDLPEGAEKDKSLGKITFTATLNGKSESFSSGNIILKKNPIVQSDGSAVTPSGGKYMNVGSGYIAEVVIDHAETFNGNTVDDYSHPTNNYLPKGTVDYCAVGTVVDPASKREYYKLRCGKRVYKESESLGLNVKAYTGKLPETNNLYMSSLEESERFTYITLETDWKAPFYFELLPQKYTNPSSRNYTVSATTYKYIDITFCYAESLAGCEAFKIGEDNPLFSHFEVIKNTSDCTLRLYLKRTGEFYGWDCEYNEQGDLVFEFLHPVKVTATDTNDYGVDLSHATVLIDVGHGGEDPGAVGPDGTTEAALTLTLANKISNELAKTGCRVLINRTSNTTVLVKDRIALIKSLKPDLVISVHRNASSSSSVSGFNTYYYYPYSKAANDAVYKHTVAAGLYDYSKNSGVGWHYFFLGRVSNCPVILSENGFISNSSEFSKMKSEKFNQDCAVATVKGIAEYFLSIQ